MRNHTNIFLAKIAHFIKDIIQICIYATKKHATRACFLFLSFVVSIALFPKDTEFIET